LSLLFLLFYFKLLLITYKNKINKMHFILGIGDWGLGPTPNPQSPIPNPQSPIPN